ncbi:transmembrane protein 45A-like isoform X1 [Peromyscus eremicus]|uniref:transmembrane protein 45A-like isoform X1 n=1 Tax=Peromyscus eremicus TaxID=42410 RepID=UPI0027DCFDA1|nr:transmembrane protein 45A-like isoform X1 [Peromyscus eremicus]XP_059133576.1 transmembrane protein 45A-like isoform X1 [Peromyscus eremicus]
MGSFKGHVLPGIFFIIMGFWWGTKSILKYVYKKQTRTCYLSSKTLFRRAEIWEGVVIIFMALTGMVGEQFISGGPSLTLYKDGQWNQLLGWHHTTMYFFFGLQGAIHILCFTTNFLPLSLSKLMLSNAIFVESFIFYNHTHGREMLDVFVHQLLVFATILGGLTTFMEFLTKNNVLLELLRSSFIILQGTWFWQIAFVLYPLKGSPPWNLTDTENKMFLTMCFSWHYASAFIIIGLNYAFITWLTSGPHLLRGWGVFRNSTRMQGKTLLRVRSPPEPADDYCLFMFQKPSDA